MPRRNRRHATRDRLVGERWDAPEKPAGLSAQALRALLAAGAPDGRFDDLSPADVAATIPRGTARER